MQSSAMCLKVKLSSLLADNVDVVSKQWARRLQSRYSGKMVYQATGQQA